MKGVISLKILEKLIRKAQLYTNGNDIVFGPPGMHYNDAYDNNMYKIYGEFQSSSSCPATSVRVKKNLPSKGHEGSPHQGEKIYQYFKFSPRVGSP